MNILGLVVEYNPFHEGHAGHLLKSLEISGADTVIAVMSGNFVQRGEPAILDKWQRTQMALDAGVDLVIELPLYYATASAERFARGAVTLLEKSGLTNCLCFGSEWANIKTLQDCIVPEDEGFKARLQESLKEGLSFPRARAKAAQFAMPDSPNNILGVQYLQALQELESDIIAYTVPRSPGSAKEIRDSLHNSGNQDYAHLNKLSSIFHYILRTSKAAELQEYVDLSEGLENRLIRFAKDRMLIADIISAAKCKRYTFLRLQRSVLHIILGITKARLAAYEAAGGPQYIRVLGFKREKAHLLRLLEERSRLPVVINLKKARLPPLAAEMLEEEIKSSKIYSLAYQDHRYLDEYTIPIR